MSETDDAPKLPVLSLKNVDAWGVAPDGSEVLINVTTATQQLQIHADYQTLVNLIIAAQAARAKAASNAAGDEGQIAVASPVAKFMVGHAAGTKGVLLVLNGETPNETIYAVEHEDAIDMGKMLTAEGMKRRNLSNAIKSVATPPKRRLILPGMQSVLIAAFLGAAQPALVEKPSPFVELCSIDTTPVQRDDCVFKMLRASRR